MIEMIGNTAKMVAIFAAAVTGGIAANQVVDQTTHVPLGLVVSAVVTAVGIAIAISRAMQKLQDSIEEMRDEIKTLQSHVSHLPCQNAKCELPK